MHTVSPLGWHVRPRPTDGSITEHGGSPFTISSGGRPIAHIASNAESEANARLIAEAPAMLEALQDAARWLLQAAERSHEPECVERYAAAYDRARAIIERIES